MPAKWFGFNIPFLTPDSVMAPQYDERLIKNDLLMLLLTSPGERRMRPTFGTILRTFPFEQLDDQSRRDIQDSIKSAIDDFEPRVKFKSINIKNDPSGTAIVLIVYVTLVNDPNRTLDVDITFPLQAA